MNFIRSIDISGILVVATLLLLPFLFFLVLNFLMVVERVLLFIERVIIRIFGEVVGKIFHVIAVVIIAIFSPIRYLYDLFNFKKRKSLGRR